MLVGLLLVRPHIIEPLAGGQSTSSEGADAKRLIGTWRVVSVTRPDGQPARGARPTGLIYYDASGHMAAQVRLIANRGETLLHAENDRTCGEDWVSYRYIARNDAAHGDS